MVRRKDQAKQEKFNHSIWDIVPIKITYTIFFQYFPLSCSDRFLKIKHSLDTISYVVSKS